jgi:glycine dehydrogenase subunit 2
VRARLGDTYSLAYDKPSMHEVVFTDKKLKRDTGVQTLDVAKRLMDFGIHPPTIYFPLVVPEALMVEPTETETKERLDAFVDAMRQIADEAATDPELLRGAPHSRPVQRLDEVRAAKEPVVSHDFGGDGSTTIPAVGLDGRRGPGR